MPVAEPEGTWFGLGDAIRAGKELAYQVALSVSVATVIVRRVRLARGGFRYRLLPDPRRR
jgi:hypothetical protein